MLKGKVALEVCLKCGLKSSCVRIPLLNISSMAFSETHDGQRGEGSVTPKPAISLRGEA